MGYKYSFKDDVAYGADDVNSIAKRLVTSGVADIFEDGVPYNASKLCEVHGHIVEKGVVPDSITSLKVTADSGTVHIAEGSAFFEDGSTIDIDSAGENLVYKSGVKNYVYLKNDFDSNKSYPACTTNAPTGDTVMLAEIDKNGTVTDKRTYAKGKLPGYMSDYNMSKVFKNCTMAQSGLDLGGTNYRFIILATSQGYGIYNISDGTYYSLIYGSGNIYSTTKAACYGRIASSIYMLRFNLSGSILTFEPYDSELSTVPVFDIYVF